MISDELEQAQETRSEENSKEQIQSTKAYEYTDDFEVETSRPSEQIEEEIQEEIVLEEENFQQEK